MEDQKVTKLWEAVLGELQLEVPRPSYETWLSGTFGLKYSEQEFVVGVPTTFVAEMLERRMYLLISNVLEKVLKSPAELRFVVMDRTDDELKLKSFGNDADESFGKTGSVLNRFGNETLVNKSDDLDGRSTINTPMNPRYMFDTFVVGMSNDLARSAALAILDNPGTIYNPLFIYSEVGLGKTHLLHAIGHKAISNGLSVIYRTTEEFTNEYINSIREGRTERFRNRYRYTDLLLLDDIQFVMGKEQTQEGFFHTFNAIHLAGRQIVITSDRPISGLSFLQDRVLSRLSGGLVVDIHPPDAETRFAILKLKAERSKSHFPIDVLQFLAETICSNVRDLEGALNRIDAYADLTGNSISMQMVENNLVDRINSAKKQHISDQMVIDVVADYFSVGKESLQGRNRDRNTAFARHVAMYILREEINLPFTAIGRILGGKDHSTVLHGCQRITKMLVEDANVRRHVINIKDELNRVKA